jgi:hypothetical protein
VMEFAARLPDRLKLRAGKTKRILRHAFRDLLPPEIEKRGKMGFGIPLPTWLRKEWRPSTTVTNSGRCSRSRRGSSEIVTDGLPFHAGFRRLRQEEWSICQVFEGILQRRRPETSGEGGTEFAPTAAMNVASMPHVSPFTMPRVSSRTPLLRTAKRFVFLAVTRRSLANASSRAASR